MRMSEQGMEQQEQQNLSGAFDYEFAEWIAAHEQDEQRLAKPILAKTETQTGDQHGQRH